MTEHIVRLSSPDASLLLPEPNQRISNEFTRAICTRQGRAPVHDTASDAHKRTDSLSLGPRPPVRHYLEIWRTRHDSNVWPSPSEGDALSAELRVLTAYAVLTWISLMSEPQRATLASHCSTILFLPHFSHKPA
jgi:hypothetical protein